MKGQEKAENPVCRLRRERFDRTGQPLPEKLVLATKRSDDQVLLRAKVLVKSHTRDACFLQDGVNGDGVKTCGAEHPLSDSKKMIAFSNGHS